MVINNHYHKNQITTFQVAATYIGTVVGAGFASGQEILQFFGWFGLKGFWGLLLASLLFIVYGYIILKLGLEYHANSHLKIIRYAGGKWLGFLIDIIITVFLFGALTAMIAGAGALFEEQFGLPSIWGNIIMVVASLITVLMGISGVISAISFVVPLLLTGIITLASMTIAMELPYTTLTVSEMAANHPPVPYWGLSAIVYASYNLVIAVAVLAPLGSQANSVKKIRNGAIFGGAGLGFGAFLILLTLLLNLPYAAIYEIPMIYVAGRFGIIIQILYSIILFAEIYTTAVGNLYGFAARMSGDSKRKYQTITIFTGFIALLLSQLGFSSLVHFLYPAVGYAGFALIIGLTYGMIKGRKCGKSQY